MSKDDEEMDAEYYASLQRPYNDRLRRAVGEYMTGIDTASSKDWDKVTKPPQQTTLAGMGDSVNKPPHYNQTELEAIDYIRMQLGQEGFMAYCEGNMLKYNHRWKYKGGAEDLKKSAWYQQRLIETKEEQDE
jgi:hypothetical protein